MRLNSIPWQYPGDEVYQDLNTVYTYVWVAEDEVHIRFFRKQLLPDGTYIIRWLNPEGDWEIKEENTYAEPSKVLTKDSLQKAIELGMVKELEPAKHVYEYNYDRCLRCKITGQELHMNFDPLVEICPGWVEYANSI